jgi:hypothetical protein
LDKAASHVERAFRDRPLVEAAVRVALANIYHDLGLPHLALPHAEIAMRRREQLLGPNAPETLHARGAYATVLGDLGHYAAAEDVFKTCWRAPAPWARIIPSTWPR